MDPSQISRTSSVARAGAKPLVLGVNSVYHQSAAALIHGGEVLFAIEEERLSRVRYAKAARVDNAGVLPWAAIDACLHAGHVRLRDLDGIALSFRPGRRQGTLGRDPYPLAPGGFGTPEGEARFDADVRHLPELFAERGGDPSVAERVHFIAHHRAHAAGAFYSAPFPRAAVLVLDGIGEDAAGWLGRGAGRDLSVLEEIPYPHSLGLLWERIAIFCGFGEYGAPKVMGLAAYGDPSRFAEPLAEILRVEKGGGAIGHEPWPFVVDNRKAQLRAPTVQALEALLGKARARDDEAVGIEMSPYADVAATLQAQTEEALLATSRRLFAATGEAALVYSGGLALNCVANTRLETEGPFSSLYVPGAAHDAGTALGAAFELARDLGAELETRDVPLTPFLGPAYASREIASSLLQAGLSGEILALGPLVERVVAALMAGELVAWFEGALELGPRALGHRSLLGDPRHLATRERFNTRIKHREVFRPFAASILDREVPRWFEVPQSGLGATMSRDLMILAYPLREEVAARVPAVRHVDGSCRIQAVDPGRQPRYHALIEAFYQATGVPLLLNTSFNDREPIVCTPDDAIRTFLRTGIDALVLEDHFVRRSPERKRVRET